MPPVEIALDQADLIHAASTAAALLKRSATTLPLLSNLLIDARETDRILIEATDLESFVRIRVPAEVKGGPARLTLPADKLAEIANLLPGGARVVLHDEGGQIKISCESNTYKLVALPAEDYPRWEAETAVTRLQVPQTQLRTLISAILYAIPQKDHRRVLMGSLMELRDMKVRLTATDGKKLSRMSVNLSEIEGANTSKVVVSGKLLGDVSRALGTEGSATIEIGERQVSFLVDNVEFRTNVIEGKYPDCDAVIPKEFPHLVRLNREAFKMAAKRAGVVSDEKNKSIILKFANDSCDFNAMAADVGTFSGRVGVEYGGTPLEIAFNYQLMIDTLDSFSHPDIRLNIKSEQSPTVLLCDAEPDHLCVLMPIKLADLRSNAAGEE